MPFISGENVGPYRIIEKLGQGGMATVYKAYHAALDRDVALKVLHPAFKEDPHFLERFHREAKLVARLEHPNIVPIYDFAEHKGQPYLVMKFIPGETLKSRLQAASISLGEGKRILTAVGDALTYAHEAGILHRDVKPSNILLAEDGKIFLADFGLARIAELGASTLSGDMLMGTPHYISPEQARGDRELDERTDIYSLGIVLYEVVVGQVPFSADTPFSIIHDHIYTPLPLPCEVNPAVPAQIQNVLLKALAKDPQDRYKSAKQLVAAYADAIEGSGIIEIPAVDLSETLSEELEPVNKKLLVVEPEGEEAAQIPVEEVDKPGASEETKRKTSWIWISLGTVITCISLLAIVAVTNRPGIRTLFAGDKVESIPTEIVVISPEATTALDSPVHPTNAPTQVPTPLRVNPVDHLERADGLVEAGEVEQASKEYILAGEMFLQLDQPVNAAGALLQAAILQDGLDRNQDQKLISLLTEALFFSAPHDDIDHLMDEFPRVETRMPFLQVLQARRLIFTGELERAELILNDTLARDEDNFLAKAILSELLYQKGDNDAAAALLSEVLQLPQIYPWLRDHLRILESKLTSSSD